ncbi:MAG: LysM peptidoglycan-binding domain-containing protein [Candidatus Limnocylindrales bacterium]
MKRHVRVGALAVPTITIRDAIRRMGHERVVAVAVAAIVLGASVASVAPGGLGGPRGDTGGPTGDGPSSRIALAGAIGNADGLGAVEEDYQAPDPSADAQAAAGAVDAPVAYVQRAPGVSSLSRIVDVDASDPEAQAAIAERAASGPIVEGPFLADGTLLKPVAVDTSVADGSDLVKTYKVKAGDTLVAIAKKHGVSMMTLWWANSLKSKDDLRRGQVLKIPPVSGLIVTVKAGDTLAALAAANKVSEARIMTINGIQDSNLVVGQVLIVPGAKGAPIPTPKPIKKAPSPPKSSQPKSGGSSSGGSSRPPKTYSGGNFAWPAPGGTISQYYR